MKFATLTIALLFSTSAFAQSAPANEPDVKKVTEISLANTIREDAQAAIAALDAGSYQQAVTLLRGASTNANLLSLQHVTEQLSQDAASFQIENSQFALADSSTISFDQFLNRGTTYERLFKDDQGRVVTVRVFGEDDDLADFMFIANDTKMLDKGGIEVAEMRGETALKKRGDDGELSVIMMSEKDHALIEVEGDDEDAVMAFINELESAQDN